MLVFQQQKKIQTRYLFSVKSASPTCSGWISLVMSKGLAPPSIEKSVASCASWAHSGSCSWRWLGGELLQELLLLSRKRLRLGRPFGKLGVQKVWPVRRTILPSNDLQRGGRLRLIFLQRPALRRRPGHGVPSLVHNLTQRLLVLLELFLAPKPNVQNRLATAIPSPLDTSSSKFTVP